MALRIEHFKSIDGVLARLRTDIRPNPFADARYRDGDYEWVTDGDRFQLVPSIAAPFWSPYLYRGQTKRHTPCRPSALRGISLVQSPFELTPQERAICLLRRVRLEEFLVALANHPATAFAESIHLRTYPIGIAQHYEVPTDRMDLTQDPEVAAFFATNECGVDGRWRPVDDPGHVGVVYRLIPPRDALRSIDPRFEWIGRQALPRPGEQKAWTLQMPLGLDLEQLPVEVMTFTQRFECGRRLNERFCAGAQLFPPDVLAIVSNAITSCKTVALRTVDRVLVDYGCPRHRLRQVRAETAEAFAAWQDVTVVDREERVLSAAEHTVASGAVGNLHSTFVGNVRAVRGARN